ncbi:MAG: ArsA family ATPase [Myxococcales bacterium]|nr:ArsA family ATPase [Myxococcales bacterium]
MLETSPREASLAGSFGEVIENKRIIVCVGSGGVGKTTTAASFAIEAARRGKHALVLTIDPAKRLATSLGLEGLGHEVQLVARERLEAIGECQPGGSLAAMMLDQKQAFDEMVENYATDAEAVKRIFENPLYQQIAGTLTGAQEYAALTKLHAFDKSGEYDIIVVDTPPTSHALDFLDAPKKLSQAIDSPAIEMFRKMQKGGSLSAIGKTGSYVFKMLAKFVGSQFIEDIALFFNEFNEILGGFKERADEVMTLLHRDDVSFVIVTSPEAMAVSEALFFHERLLETDMPFAGFAVNKVHTSMPVDLTRDGLVEELGKLESIKGLGLQATCLRMGAETLLDAHSELERVARTDRIAIQRLKNAAPKTIRTEVPFFRDDVHHIESLGRLRGFLFG